jgi:hypothetical protein
MKLGCVVACGVATLPIIATQTGQHILVVRFAGVEFQYAFDAISGENIKIELSELNEDGCIKFKIIQPNGTYYSTTSEDETYECFMLRTSILMTAPIALPPCVQDYVVQDYWPDDYVGCGPPQQLCIYVECGYAENGYVE